MKCEACGSENIYGSKVCKSCDVSMVRAESVAASPPPALLVVPAKADSKESGSQELNNIPYTGNKQFDHFIRGLRFAFDFKGRTGRAGYWHFTLFQVLFLIVLQVVSKSLADLAILISLVSTLAIWFRRLHDTGRSGWWLLAGMIPVVNLVLICFAVQEGSPMDNAWGPGVAAHN
jgi:uncharacterized membrane protein YhaH (DUF805 family)